MRNKRPLFKAAFFCLVGDSVKQKTSGVRRIIYHSIIVQAALGMESSITDKANSSMVSFCLNLFVKKTIFATVFYNSPSYFCCEVDFSYDSVGGLFNLWDFFHISCAINIISKIQIVISQNLKDLPM